MSPARRYHAFGLDFQSEIMLPEMRAGSGSGGEAVAVVLGAAPRPPGLIDIEAGVAAGPRDFWMAMPGTATIHVADGARITIEAAPGVPTETIRPFLLGSAMGALMLQRGLLPLHASAVEVDGRAVLFCGTSGAGKSSIAFAMTRRGHRLLSDDLCALDLAGGVPGFWPGLVNLKLWRASLTAAGEAADGLAPVLPTLDKYRRPVETVAAYRRHEAAAIILLGADAATAPGLTRMAHGAGVAALVSNTFRGQLVQAMDAQRRHFDQCVEVARAVGVGRLNRRWDLSAIDASCRAVEDALRTS